MKILIAEDNFTDRLILNKIIQVQGHEVIEAENGKQAVEKFSEESPDLVLLDALMPIMDGFEAAKEIKKVAGEVLIPIIFITSLKDPDQLVRCFEAGDDFLTKPFNKVILEAKINAFDRTNKLYQMVQQQRDEIETHSKHLLHEQQVAKRIFDNIVHSGGINESNIKHTMSPLAIFNGDILLVVKRPLGGVNVFLGDFTGHGLPAAIGALPTSEIFIGMSRKGFEVYEILHEVNRRLKSILPIGFFCCAAAAQIDFAENTIHFWNGGLPHSYLIDKQSGEIEELKSSHLPLGILDESSFKTNLDIRPFKNEDSLFIFSDGVTEAENSEGEMFGSDRLLVALCESASEGTCFETVNQAVKQHTGEKQQGDDITIVEITNDADLVESTEAEPLEVASTDGPSDSAISLQLGPESLKHFNPLPVLSQHVMDIGHLRSFRAQVMTILTELYSNALEHGVLGLSSNLKSSVDGFAEYYRQREQRLNELEEGFVNIKVKHEVLENGGRLFITVEDSGNGFDYSKVKQKAEESGFSGRGYPLMFKLSESLEFSKNGSQIDVVFRWEMP